MEYDVLDDAAIYTNKIHCDDAIPSGGKEKLAIHGGTPIRKSPLHYQPYGPQFYDDVEKQELIDVLESKAPFRWWNPDSKVLQFEKAYAAHMGVKHALGVTSGTTADMDPIMEIARKHKVRVPEDCAQCLGGRYKGKHVRSIGDIGINSFQLSKSITSGEGGAVVSNDPELFERAIRFHDVGVVRSPYKELLKGGLLAAFTSCNFRMSEFTGAVLKRQLKQPERICGGLRKNAKKVRQGIADLPGLKMRKTPDREGDLGVTIFLDHGTRKRRAQFLRALRAEGIAASGAGGSAILPTDGRIENKCGDPNDR